MKNYRQDFPILKRKINGKKLIYLDSAATSQKPQAVIDAISDYYQNYNSNVKRSLYPIAEEATKKMEDVRRKTAKFINASPEEIIFVRNATEAINLVMQTWGKTNIQKGDRVTATIMEHHANFVPWQQLACQKQAEFKVIDFDENFQFSNRSNRDDFHLKSKLLAITHVSNVLGTINPIKEIIKKFRIENPDGVVVVDAAQSVPHMGVDVKALDADFLVFSGHKMMAGTGIGILYGKKKLLEKMPPFLFGGEMIKEVRVKETIFADLPEKFEAGTPDIAGIVSLGVAIDYLENIGMDEIKNYELRITNYALEQLKRIEGIKIYGSKDTKERGGIVSFTLDDIHPHDIAQVLGDMGICIRASHHCAMPLHTRLGIPATARASFYLYNDESDIDALIKGLHHVKKVFKK